MRRQHVSILTTSVLILIAVCIIVSGTWDIFPKAQSQTLSNASQDQVSAAELASAIDAQKQADANLVRGESAERRFQDLSAKLQQATTETTPVIVELSVAFTPEAELV